MYYDYALAADLMADAEQGDKDILILGMGTGTFAVQTERYFPGNRITGVEIDGKITDLARTYFSLPEAVPVTTYDGRAYLAADKNTYDVIMVDAYQDITIPFQMSSSEFFTLVRSHLKPGGVMVVNMNMRSDKAGSINSYLADTIASVFPYVYTVEVPGTTNRELFAAETDVFADFAKKIPALKREDLQGQMYSVNHRLTPYEAGGLLLTDDRAPVELLGMAVIDDLIQEELAYYKQIIREDGIAGLISAAAG